jgi:hypothetical protein
MAHQAEFRFHEESNDLLPSGRLRASGTQLGISLGLVEFFYTLRTSPPRTPATSITYPFGVNYAF